MDVSEPLINKLPECISNPVEDDSRSRDKSPTPEVKVQASSDVTLDVGDESSSTANRCSCVDEQMGNRLVRTLSDQLPTIVFNDVKKDDDSHSWHEKSNFKLTRGVFSLDGEKSNRLKPQGFGTQSDYTRPVCLLHTNPPSTASSTSYLRHRIMIEEVVPSSGSIIHSKNGDEEGDEEADEEGDEEKEWRMSIDGFSSKRRGKKREDKALPRRIRRYYKTQDELISAFEDLHTNGEDGVDNSEAEAKLRRLASIMSQVSLAANLLLLIGKAVAAGLTGSLSVISAVIDSAVDLVSGGLMWWSNRAIKNRDLYRYPQGRTKLEPVAIVIVSVVMALASVQMIRESVEKIIDYATQDAIGPVFDIASIVLCVFTVVMKIVLFVVCRRIKTPSTQTLAEDHRNDIISNTGAVICGYIGYKYWKYLDPIGATVIALYIIISWSLTGWAHIKMLTGHTARPDFLKKITWIALNHHPEVLLIDTVRAFHFGNNFLVEVDIVLPEEMNLRQAHDIGESLQVKIENLTEVERAFVHLDYECDHSPFSEHKQV